MTGSGVNDATSGRARTIGTRPVTTRRVMIESRDPTHHDDIQMRTTTTTTTHFSAHRDRTTFILAVLGACLLGLLALLQR